MTAPFCDPPDDPETVTQALRVAGQAAGRLHEQSRLIRQVGSELPAAWRGPTAAVAVTELAAVASLLNDAAGTLRAGSAALAEYRAALAQAAPVIDALRSRYGEVVQDRELRSAQAVAPLSRGAPAEMRAARTDPVAEQAQPELDALTDRFGAVTADLRAAAHRLAGKLAAAADALHVAGAPTPLGVTQRFAGALPVWGAPVAERAARDAAAAAESGLPPDQLRQRLQQFSGWADVPAFGRAFLHDVGPERFAALLARPVQALYGDPDPPGLAAAFALLGRILAAGTRVDPDRAWLGSLVHTMPDNLRIGLGLALRHGRYGADALEALIPPLLAHPGDPGIWIQRPVGDPLVGAMSALAGNPVAARRILADRDRLTVLLHRRWAEDGGRSLGFALAAAAAGDPPDLLFEPVVDAVGADPDALPAGAATGLGQFLGANIEAVNQSLPNDQDVPLPHLGPGRRLDHRVRLARTLFAAMHSREGSAAIYAHQAAYAGAVISRGHSLEAELDGVAENYGRLAGIHQRAIVDLADRADAADETGANADTWISMAQFAAGLIPVTAGPVAGLVKGQVIGSAAAKLEDELYRKPLERRTKARHAAAGKLIDRELAASEQFSAQLIERAYPKGAPAPFGDLTFRTVLHQAGQAGQNDVTRVLLPDRAPG
ncbi:MAG TPA: hypothetical protein VHC49_01770 [Mycobacteriales bacterium]|nr:hypothetical protein [Mycobacteriales bacterium]